MANGRPQVYNVPKWADEYQYIVVSVVNDGERWFYKAFNELGKALEASWELDKGEVLTKWKRLSF